MFIGINKKRQMERKINASNFKLVKQNKIKNKNSIGNPIYKSVISMNFPNVLFKLLTVIYIIPHLYFCIFYDTYFC